MKTFPGSDLAISAIPFRSSNLAIPVSPFSPQFPITPPASPPEDPAYACSTGASRAKIPPTVPPPKSPLNWVWQCHVCHVRYPLSVTRRCLEDGHNFCAGTTVVRTKRGKNGERTRVVRRHRACSSEFDYQGWKAWGDWRRSEEEVRNVIEDMILKEAEEDGNSPITLGLGLQWQMERHLRKKQQDTSQSGTKDCWNKCDYPSECRWSAQLQQQETPPPPVTPVVVTANLATSAPSQPMTQVMQPEDSKTAEATPTATTFDTILENIDLAPSPSKDTVQPPQREAFWGALLASATRRKSAGSPRTTVSSPLALSPVLELDESDSSSSSSTSDGERSPSTSADGDIEMVDIAPSDQKYTPGSDPVSKMRAPEPTLQMPSLASAFSFGFELWSKESWKNSERKDRDKRNDYVGNVETLRWMNRSH